MIRKYVCVQNGRGNDKKIRVCSGREMKGKENSCVCRTGEMKGKYVRVQDGRGNEREEAAESDYMICEIRELYSRQFEN